MTVGQQLQQVRTARKLSFTDVTAATKIQPWVLEALESDRLPELMSPVYVKGFLSTYARFLKLDPAPLVAGLQWPQPLELEEALVQQEELPPVPVQAKRAAVAARAAAVAEAPPPVLERKAPARPRAAVPEEDKAPAALRLPVFRMPRLPQFRMPRFEMPAIQLPRIPRPVLQRAGQALAAAAAIAVVIMVHPLQYVKKTPWPTLRMPAVAKAHTESDARKAPVKKASAKPVAASKRTASASVAPIGDALKPPPPQIPAPVAVEPLDLVVTANRTTWIKVRADGKLLSQQRLVRGANEHWSAKKQLEVIVSKPSQVELTLNGQSISPLAIAHRGRLLITHRGVGPLPEPKN